VRALDAILATPTETDEDLRALDGAELMIDKALKILRTGNSAAYAQALAALPKAMQAEWEDELACEPDDLDLDEAPATADRAGLLRFLEQEVRPSHTQRRTELNNQSLIRAPKPWVRRLIPTGWNSLAVTRCILTANWKEHSPCSSG
jgi:hypothetical protein